MSRQTDLGEGSERHAWDLQRARMLVLPQAFDDVAAMFNTFARCMRGFEDERPALDELSRAAKKLGLTSAALAHRALSDDDGSCASIRAARTQMDRLRARQVIDMLTLLVQRHFLWPATDIRRLRRTAAMQHLRLEVEAVGLALLMRKEPAVAKEWVSVKTEAEGRGFHKRNNRKVLEQLEVVELLSAYNAASGSGQHARLTSLVHAVTVDESRERWVTTMNLPEWQDARPHDFLNWALWFLRIQERIFRALLAAFPDAHDGVFIERVRLLERLITSLYETLCDKIPKETSDWQASGEAEAL